MRLTYHLAGASLSLVLAAMGTAEASPIYGTAPPATPADGVISASEQASDHALWSFMTNDGARGAKWDLRAAPRGDSAIAYTDLLLYQAAVGSTENILFTAEEGVSPGDMLHTHYVDRGVLFDGDDQVLGAGAFVTDERGVHGNGSIEIQFAAPQTHIGIEFPGDLRIELYDGAALLWTSESAGDFGAGPTGNFGGVVTVGQSFDRAILSDPVDGFVFIDNLHYEVVPEPSSLFVLAIGGLAVLGRRRPRR